MKVFGIQFSITWQDKPANFARVGDLVAEAGPPAGSLIVLPEMFATGFSMEVDVVVDDGGVPCPDCDDNSLAGSVPKGEPFPTGDLHPPAHPGCRCIAVPA